jgi:hypothetical protein
MLRLMRVRFRAEFAEMRSASKDLRVYVLVTIAKTSELLLAGGIPHVEADGAEVGVEGERVDLNAKGGCRHEEEFRREGDRHRTCKDER